MFPIIIQHPAQIILEYFIIFLYHVFVAQKKTNNNSKGAQAVVIFWLVFVIIVVCVFMANAETIKTNFDLFKTRLTSGNAAEEQPFLNDEEPYIITEQPSPPAGTRTEPTVNQSEGTQTAAPAQTQPAQSTQTPQTQPAQTQQQNTEPVKTINSVIYFTQVSSDGQILQSRVTRRIPDSASPMMDALNILLAGPTAEEISRGILNLIPQNTRILSYPIIRGTTAHINFSEDFMFNTFGVEGYIAQLRQIVWTVTEFPTVNNVQILIEGEIRNYLGDSTGIVIGVPIGRQSF